MAYGGQVQQDETFGRESDEVTSDTTITWYESSLRTTLKIIL